MPRSTRQGKRIVVKKLGNTGRGKPAAGKPTLGNSNKAIRDGADANARTGKDPVSFSSLRAFKGEVVIEAKLSPKQKEEILNIVRNSGKTGPRDTNDRVLQVQDAGGKMRITTTGQELAVSIGKKVHQSHKDGKLTLVWGSAEQPVRVTWVKK